MHLIPMYNRVFMKKILLLLAGTIAFIVVASAGWYAWKLHLGKNTSRKASTALPASKALVRKLTTRAASLQNYAVANGYDTTTCFLIDMSIESGRNRFFVYNMSREEMMETGLVTHGRCNQSWLSGRKYGNEPGCGCSSLGKYKIGQSYNGKFGLAYKLHGLDKSNSNAFRRFVVLHSHSCVPGAEVDPYPICQSDGCPTVSPVFLKALATRIDQSSKPLLLWIFE